MSGRRKTNSPQNNRKSSQHFPKSKRRKTSGGNAETVVDNDTSGNSHRNRWKCPIMHMPTEVLMNIFKHVSFTDIAQSVRIVNRRFKVISEDMLNVYFKNLRARLEQLRKTTHNSISQTNDETELRCCCKLLNLLDFLIFYHGVIMATIWRYVYEKKHAKFCMYAGQILDAYSEFLVQFSGSPLRLWDSANTRSFKHLPPEIQNLCLQARTFCNYFESKSEYTINNVFVSGCKILDILDCSEYAITYGTKKKITGNTLQMKMHYYFSNSWFVALDAYENEKKETSWREQQKYMYLRLRRLVINHSEMNMIQNQYQRETVLLAWSFYAIPKPHCSVYTGYGETSSKFFFYGVMNDGAYNKKFLEAENHPDESDFSDEESEYQLEDDEEINNSASDVTKYSVPYLGVHISVSLKCPLHLAPRRVLETTKERKKQETTYGKSVFDLQMMFDCPGAHYPRLPETYYFNVKDKK